MSVAGVGVYISRVEEGSIAERAGLRPGDSILEVNGTPFTGISHEEALKVSIPHLPTVYSVQVHLFIITKHSISLSTSPSPLSTTDIQYADYKFVKAANKKSLIFVSL